MSSKSTRKGPTESATKFKVRTKKIGNDGNIWVVAETITGTHRWVPYKTNTGSIIIKNDMITLFNFTKIVSVAKGKIKYIGHLDITSNKIGVGETVFGIYQTKKGRYNIYYYNYSLIALHEDQLLKDQTFKLQKGTAECDFGMFGYNDFSRIKKYIKPTKKTRLIFPTFDPVFYDKHNKIRNYEYVYESDFMVNKNTTDVDDRHPIAIFADNGYGDGGFPIYKGKNAFLIMSHKLETLLLNKFGQ